MSADDHVCGTLAPPDDSLYRLKLSKYGLLLAEQATDGAVILTPCCSTSARPSPVKSPNSIPTERDSGRSNCIVCHSVFPPHDTCQVPLLLRATSVRWSPSKSANTRLPRFEDNRRFTRPQVVAPP